MITFVQLGNNKRSLRLQIAFSLRARAILFVFEFTRAHLFQIGFFRFIKIQLEREV